MRGIGGATTENIMTKTAAETIRQGYEAQRAAASAMLAALKMAEVRASDAFAESGTVRHHEVWRALRDAIAQAEAAGIKVRS